MVYLHLDALAAAGVRGARRPKGATETRTECVLASGAEIVALPAKPETIRGYTGDVHLDEFALHADAAEIIAAVVPATTLGFTVSIASTPFGDDGEFTRVYRDAERLGFERHTTSIHDAVAAGFPADVESLHALLSSPEDFEQEYEVAFISAMGAYLDAELLRRSIADAPDETPEGALITIGVDVARRVDLTVAAAMVRVAPRSFVRDLLVMRNEPLPAQTDRVHAFALAHGAYRVAVDATGLGQHMADELARRGPYAVDAVQFTSDSKERMVTLTRAALERGELALLDDRDLIADFHAIRRSVTSGGVVRYDAERSEQRGHADRFWAVALALSAGTTDVVSSWMPHVGSAARAADAAGFAASMSPPSSREQPAVEADRGFASELGDRW